MDLEEISCETDLVSNYENLEGIVRISEIAFGRIIINESYTEGWNMYQPKTKRI